MCQQNIRETTAAILSDDQLKMSVKDTGYEMSGSTETCIPSFTSNFGSLLMLHSIRFSALCTKNTRTDVCVIFFTQLKEDLGCPLPCETLL
jgi:hypothetical protein